jgi:3-mercaptopyruvate sulfurtransferase SseA
MRAYGLFGSSVLVACLPGLCGCETSTSDKDIAKESVLVSLADVRQLMNEAESGEDRPMMLIDPRAPKFFAEGHLPGATNLRLPEVREDAARDPAIEQYGRLVVYGDNPGSPVARAMFKRLLAVGYSGVRFYPGGVDEWLRSGYPLETSEPPVADDEGEGQPSGEAVPGGAPGS